MNHKIAVFTNGFSNEFLELIITGLRKKAKADDMDVFVFVTYCSQNAHELQNKCQLNIFHLPDPDDFDGAIMLTNTYNFPDEQERVCARFQRAGVPMLSLEVEVPNMSCIKSENYRGMRQLTKHLVEEHHVRKILYFNGVKGNVENETRRRAVTDVLTEHGIQLYGEIQGDFGYYNAYVQMNAYLKKTHNIPDAVICANDLMALGVNSAASMNGYKVPDDIIITGFDMIKDGQNTFPMLATVSRGWESFGETAYDKLMYQIAHPDEKFNEEYDSYFVPAESCGCEAAPEANKKRFDSFKNMFFNNFQTNIMDETFQQLQIPISLSTHKEDFYEKGMKQAYDLPLFGKNYCLCTEPEFFELSDDEYPERIRGYSSDMDILYELRDGQRRGLAHFDSRVLYPEYKHVKGESNLYIFAPLNYLNFIIGYIAIKNSPELLFNLDLVKYIKNMNALLFGMRRYIFSQRTNEELKRIYMNDALTGMYNRTGCENVLYEAINERKKSGQKSLLVFADIDRMKTINDVHGHLKGDFAIKATAFAFKKYSPDDWLFGRYGGDEFIAVGSCPDESQIVQLIKEISESMSKEFESLNLAFILHASVGYTVIDSDDDGTIEDYISRADKAMYAEKEKYHKIIDSME